MAKIKVIHLEMDGQHYYFGSLKALHETMGEERMGMKFNSFHSNVRVSPDKSYTNRRHGYTIRMGFLTQTKTNRNALHLHPLPADTDSADSLREEGRRARQSQQEVNMQESLLFNQEPTVVETMPAIEDTSIAKETPIVEETSKSKRSKKQKNDYGQLDLFGI